MKKHDLKISYDIRMDILNSMTVRITAKTWDCVHVMIKPNQIHMNIPLIKREIDKHR